MTSFTLVPTRQVNPLAETPDGKLLAADAKLGFDDNAHYRQKPIFDMRDESQIDPRCVMHGTMVHDCVAGYESCHQPFSISGAGWLL